MKTIFSNSNLRVSLLNVSLAVLSLAEPARAADGYKVNVAVDVEKVSTFMSPVAIGVQTQISDGELMTPETVKMIRASAVTALRYPGGRVSSVYHWSTNTQTNWQGSEKPSFWIPPQNHFGNFVALLDQTAAKPIITVNYGSNLAGTGPGEPAEAAAWVAYANGDPSDTRQIGTDSTGQDWKTVGYWATMRASQPLEQEDGYNFLRIGHPRPLRIVYWEIGNEPFANGYYATKHKQGGDVEDLHFRYSSNKNESEKIRNGNRALGPVAYGTNVIAFAKAMKSVDPNIKIGVALVTPKDGEWAPDWNSNVIKTAGHSIDLLAVHWRPGNLLPPDWKAMDVPSLLAAPQNDLPVSGSLLELIQKNCAPGVQMAITEFAPGWGELSDPIVKGLFAADTFTTLIESGFVNADLLELHDGFLGEKNTPSPAYFGTLMSRIFMMPNDLIVASTSSKAMVSVHAAKRADGSVAIMLLNKDPKLPANVNVTIKGAQLANTGMRFDYGPSNPPTGASVARAPINNVGNSFTVTVPPYTISDIKIPRAQ